MESRGSDSPTRGRSQGRGLGVGAALGLALAAAGVYVLIAGGFRFEFRPTRFAHHMHLADAFLRGQMYLPEHAVRELEQRARDRADAEIAAWAAETGRNPTTDDRARARERELRVARLDWSEMDGRLYGYWGPLLPALMMPIVAVWGTGVSDALVSAVLGGLNVALFGWLLRRVDRRGLCPLEQAAAVGLVLVLAFGSMHLYMASAGTVWLAAQLVALTAVLATCVAMTGARNALGGVAWGGVFFGAALLGRNITVLMLPFFVMLIWLRAPGAGALRRRAALGRLMVFIVPCAAAIGVQAWYNQARFGSVFDTGQAVLIRATGDPRYRVDFEQYGQFHPHFVLRNARHYFWHWGLVRDENDEWTFDPEGNAMFLVTPPLVYALLAWRRRSGFTLALVAGVVPFMVGLLMFRATGYRQFGNRYLLEALPLLLLLVGCGTRGRLTDVGFVLMALAIGINLWGTSRFCHEAFEPVAPWMASVVWPVMITAALLAWLGFMRRRGRRNHVAP